MTDHYPEYLNCRLCPRSCGVNRYDSRGFCMAGTEMKLARAGLHHWEEPCLSGDAGSGAVFFSNCSLRCLYCQNWQISHEGFGKEVSAERLKEIVSELRQAGAVSLDLVTPTHYLPQIREVLKELKPGLDIPVIWNCGGYETPESIRSLEGLADIWLPDLKYADASLAAELSGSADYPDTAMKAIRTMTALSGPPVLDAGTGLMKKGVLVRHLVLPGHKEDSIRLLQRLADEIGPENVLLSLLSQYTPFYRAGEIRGLDRRLTSYEYGRVLETAVSLGFRGYMQEKSSAKEEYTPTFDLSGV